ncbi:hypothetical protein GW17_00009942 [Ensete ventricosum]|nr:hypothetical protein GW17_00009942 [Ensete ventricosum]
MGGLPVDLDGLPVVNSRPLVRFCGTGGSPATWAVYPSKATARRPDSMVWAAHRRFTHRNFRKSGSLHFSNSGFTFTGREENRRWWLKL